MLLVQDDPLFCKLIAKYLKSSNTDDLKYALTGTLGARMIAGGAFDIALINATLPDISGIELAMLARNENVAVLMLSQNTRVSEELKQFDYQYLQRPFSFRTLLSESKRVVQESRASFCRSRAIVSMPNIAAAEANLEALRLEMVESNRMFDAIVARLGYWRS
jgi:DNA-binding response OmpR family regulator